MIIVITRLLKKLKMQNRMRKNSSYYRRINHFDILKISDTTKIKFQDLPVTYTYEQNCKINILLYYYT